MTTLLPALIFHVMQDVGTLAEHFFELTGQSLANSSWANRRQRLPWDVFDALLRRLLRPLAVPATHEDAPAPRLSAAKVLRVTTALCLAVQLGEGRTGRRPDHRNARSRVRVDASIPEASPTTAVVSPRRAPTREWLGRDSSRAWRRRGRWRSQSSDISSAIS